MICIPIGAASTEAALEKMERAAPLADILELRIDRIGDPDLARLLRGPRPPVIVTNRRQEEGGGFAGPEDERIALLAEAARRGVDYLDIEVATAPVLKTALRKACETSGTKWIASWHDVSETPSAEVLQRRFSEAIADTPAIVKMVAQARRPEDNLRMLELIPWSHGMGQAIAAFCMGEAGSAGRLMAHLLGSAISFAALDEGEASAPGQLTARQFREMVALLRLAAPTPIGEKGSTSAEAEAPQEREQEKPETERPHP